MEDRWRCQKNVVTPCQLFFTDKKPRQELDTKPTPHNIPSSRNLAPVATTTFHWRQLILSSDYHYVYLFDWISLPKKISNTITNGIITMKQGHTHNSSHSIPFYLFLLFSFSRSKLQDEKRACKIKFYKIGLVAVRIR